MFFKVILTSLAIGALSVNALSVPVALQDVEARGNFDIGPRPVSIYGDPTKKNKPKHNSKPKHESKHKREISDLLFSRKPEDWAQRGKVVRDQVSKREPGGGKATASAASNNKATGSTPTNNKATKDKPADNHAPKPNGASSGKSRRAL